MWLFYLSNLTMGGSPYGTVTLDVYPDPFGATSVSTLDPFAATARYKGT